MTSTQHSFEASITFWQIKLDFEHPLHVHRYGHWQWRHHLWWWHLPGPLALHDEWLKAKIVVGRQNLGLDFQPYRFCIYFNYFLMYIMVSCCRTSLIIFSSTVSVSPSGGPRTVSEGGRSLEGIFVSIKGTAQVKMKLVYEGRLKSSSIVPRAQANFYTDVSCIGGRLHEVWNVPWERKQVVFNRIF